MSSQLKCFFSGSLVLGCFTAMAFIPPLPSILKDMLDARKMKQPVEFTLRHKVYSQSTIEIEERMIRDRGRTMVIWKSSGQAMAAVSDSQGYSLSREKNIASKSQLVVRYLFADNPDNFRDVLLNEKFIRRDQLLQFKPNFDPKGDPATWALKDNYLRHDDIFLTRLDSLFAIQVVGLNEGDTLRSVYFDQRLRGLLRVDWKDAGQLSQWNLFPGGGDFSVPKRMEFLVNNSSVATTELSHRTLKEKQLNDFRAEWKTLAAKTPAISPELEGALRALLSYR